MFLFLAIVFGIVCGMMYFILAELPILRRYDQVAGQLDIFLPDRLNQTVIRLVFNIALVVLLVAVDRTTHIDNYQKLRIACVYGLLNAIVMAHLCYRSRHDYIIVEKESLNIYRHGVRSWIMRAVNPVCIPWSELSLEHKSMPGQDFDIAEYALWRGNRVTLRICVFDRPCELLTLLQSHLTKGSVSVNPWNVMSEDAKRGTIISFVVALLNALCVMIGIAYICMYALS